MYSRPIDIAPPRYCHALELDASSFLAFSHDQQEKPNKTRTYTTVVYDSFLSSNCVLV